MAGLHLLKHISEKTWGGGWKGTREHSPVHSSKGGPHPTMPRPKINSEHRERTWPSLKNHSLSLANICPFTGPWAPAVPTLKAGLHCTGARSSRTLPSIILLPAWSQTPVPLHDVFCGLFENESCLLKDFFSQEEEKEKMFICVPMTMTVFL